MFFFRSVSWVRERDSHIITVGNNKSLCFFLSYHFIQMFQVDEETFISDDRFVSLKKAKESLWTLKVGSRTDDINWNTDKEYTVVSEGL